MYELLQGKRILVAGGSSGLGLEVAKLADASGARVVIASRTAPGRREMLVREVSERIELISLDVTSASDTRAALRPLGSVDHLVFAVRASLPAAPFLQTSFEDARYALDTKLLGAWQLIRLLQTQLAADGSIVMVSGIAGEKVYAGASTMAMVNGATEALCRALAVELAPIRVNVVSPGFVAPKGPEVTALARRFPSGRLAEPGEVAAAVLSLLSQSYITGTTLVVDGGARLV